MGCASGEGQDDERPAHEVELAAFDCAVYPVTEEEYAEFLAATGPPTPQPPRLQPSTPTLPVTSVSWLDAVAYCDWRTALGEPMRLPTEAEWERAARGGLDRARYPWGNEIPAWVPDGGRGPLPGPWPVGLGEPNGLGLYGIGGNIHEWCSDWHAATYYAESPLLNPRGPASGRRRASRGGAWRHAITVSRCSQRSRIAPELRYSDYGFRVVRSVATFQAEPLGRDEAPTE